PAFLVLFGVSCFGLALGMYFLDRDNRSLVRWMQGRVAFGILGGVAAALLVVAPLAVLYRYTPIESRGGAVPLGNVPAVLVFALLGNLLEEMLFRGYVYGLLAERMASLPAGIWSGVVFAFCHI